MKIGDLLVFLLVILLFVILSPIIVPLTALLYLKEKLDQRRFRRFLKANEGAKYFCYTNRRTSQEFVRGRILPELPDDVDIIFMSDKGRVNLGDESKFQNRIVWSMRAVPGGFPYISKIVNGELVTESINNKLYNTIKRDVDPEQVMSKIRKFFE